MLLTLSPLLLLLLTVELLEKKWKKKCPLPAAVWKLISRAVVTKVKLKVASYYFFKTCWVLLVFQETCGLETCSAWVSAQQFRRIPYNVNMPCTFFRTSHISKIWCYISHYCNTFIIFVAGLARTSDLHLSRTNTLVIRMKVFLDILHFLAVNR